MILYTAAMQQQQIPFSGVRAHIQIAWGGGGAAGGAGRGGGFVYPSAVFRAPLPFSPCPVPAGPRATLACPGNPP